MRALAPLALGAIAALAACAPTSEQDTEDPVEEESGEEIFNRVCAVCHGVDGRGGVSAPDLQDVAAGMDTEDLTEVVLYGSGYMEPLRLSEAQAIAVSAYIAEEYLVESP